LSGHQKGQSRDVDDDKALASNSREMVKDLFTLSGMDAINNLLSRNNSGQLVKNMTRVDLFWLIKKIGEDDSLPILKMASNDQWQYLLDMEIWQRDQIDLGHTFTWLDRLHQADPDRFAKWLYDEGNLLTRYCFYKSLQVELKEDDDQDLPEGFFTLDNLYYIRILDEEHREVIESIIRKMAQVDYNRYQALLLGLAGVQIPEVPEVEEEMYRLRGVRLAEDGYLPFEEAISVYSYQKADLLKPDESAYKLFLPSDTDTRALVSVTPIINAQGDNLLSGTLAGITEALLLERLWLEFAGLCNQILSSDGTILNDIMILRKTCRKAAGYINIGLERLSADDIPLSERFLKNNALISIFRAGFGLALELKWEAEKWMKEAWFQSQDLTSDFWGDEWGGTLAGILLKKPLLFSGLKEGEEFRDFETLSEVKDCRNIINRLVVLDRLIRDLYSSLPLDKKKIKDPLLTYHPFLFNFWVRVQLKFDPGLTPLSLTRVRDFFRLVRVRDKQKPFRMPGFKEVFIEDLMSHASGLDPDDIRLLKETLSILWQEFVEEYARVAIDDLDERFSRFILARPDSESSE